MRAARRAGRLLVFLAMVAAACAGLAARAQVLLDANSPRVELWPHVRVMADPTKALTFEQVLPRRDAFTPPAGAYATMGMNSREALWLRVPFRVAAGGAGQWILAFDYALLRRVDVYVAVAGAPARHVALGNSLPFEARALQGRTLAAPLELSAGATGEILMRVDTLGGKLLPVTLSRLSSFHASALHEQLLQGVLGGLGLLLVLYSLAQWLHLRESLYLKYALLVTCSVMFSVHFFGLGEMYLWTDREWPETHLAGITSLLAAAATALFVEDALAGDLHRWLRRGLRAVAGVHVAAALAHGLDLIDIRTVGILMNTTGLAPALMGLPGAIAKARRGDSVGTWFIVAWVGYFIASFILVGVVRGTIGANFWTLHSFQIGATLDMLVFMRIAVLRSAARHDEAQRAVVDRERLKALAHTDALTGLLNRRGLDDALPAAVGRATPERLLVLYLLDLDGFKPVNDRFGHDTGDALLRVIAQRLTGCLRSGDVVARFGGDEFVVMAEGIPNEAQARDLGAKLLETFRSRVVLGRNECGVSATIGYALAPADAATAQSLLKAADAAMYRGKQEGKDRLLRATQESVLAPA